ncbi:hypothetical protein [Defluviimonas sp. SAOS-178_SWC]|uniref:hypothetical protein n=1 Tax=Defluviimonas sp. SAOS-178_SWC TaxID=3121287 RepID=UPI0032218374
MSLGGNLATLKNLHGAYDLSDGPIPPYSQKRKGEAEKWKKAWEIRNNWTDAEFEAEKRRLAEEIEAMKIKKGIIDDED